MLASMPIIGMRYARRPKAERVYPIACAATHRRMPRAHLSSKSDVSQEKYNKVLAESQVVKDHYFKSSRMKYDNYRISDFLLPRIIVHAAVSRGTCVTTIPKCKAADVLHSVVIKNIPDIKKNAVLHGFEQVASLYTLFHHIPWDGTVRESAGPWDYFPILLNGTEIELMLFDFEQEKADIKWEVWISDTSTKLSAQEYKKILIEYNKLFVR